MNIFQNMFKSKVRPTQKVAQAFDSRFPNAISVEWVCRNNDYEAVFYFDGIECIALYDDQGNLFLLKKNLSIDKLPKLIAEQSQKEGELMNAVAVESNQSVMYQLIVRDKALVRYVLYINEAGHITEKKTL